MKETQVRRYLHFKTLYWHSRLVNTEFVSMLLATASVAQLESIELDSQGRASDSPAESQKLGFHNRSRLGLKEEVSGYSSFLHLFTYNNRVKMSYCLYINIYVCKYIYVYIILLFILL